MREIFKWFSKNDQDLEEIQDKTDDLLDKVEQSLPKVSGQQVCAALRRKPKNKWTDADWTLWNRHGCR